MLAVACDLDAHRRALLRRREPDAPLPDGRKRWRWNPRDEADPSTAEGAATLARLRMAPDSHLDAPIGESGRTLADALVDQRPSIEDVLMREEERTEALRAVRQLDRLERDVLRHRFAGGATLAEAGRWCGRTGAGIAHIERHALEQVRELVGAALR